MKEIKKSIITLLSTILTIITTILSIITFPFIVICGVLAVAIAWIIMLPMNIYITWDNWRMERRIKKFFENSKGKNVK